MTAAVFTITTLTAITVGATAVTSLVRGTRHDHATDMERNRRIRKAARR